MEHAPGRTPLGCKHSPLPTSLPDVLKPIGHKIMINLVKLKALRMRFPGMNERCMFWQGWTLANLVPRVLLETKVPWWIVVTWLRFIAQILGNKTIYFLYFPMFLD